MAQQISRRSQLLSRDHLGNQLQAFYASILAEAQPQRHLDLIAQLDAALMAQGDAAHPRFAKG